MPNLCFVSADGTNRGNYLFLSPLRSLFIIQPPKIYQTLPEIFHRKGTEDAKFFYFSLHSLRFCGEIFIHLLLWHSLRTALAKSK